MNAGKPRFPEPIDEVAWRDRARQVCGASASSHRDDRLQGLAEELVDAFRDDIGVAVLQFPATFAKPMGYRFEELIERFRAVSGLGAGHDDLALQEMRTEMARTCLRTIAASVCLIAEESSDRPVAAAIRRICFRTVISFIVDLLPDDDAGDL